MNYWLVALSLLTAVCASYTALDVAGRATATTGRMRNVWLVGGAASMGLGIWSMHYIGMLAFGLPAMTGDREACLAAGTDGYLSKPVNANDLFALIEELTGTPSVVPGPAVIAPIVDAA
jgi:hypothetical protein